jgi:hypothetical protein
LFSIRRAVVVMPSTLAALPELCLNDFEVVIDVLLRASPILESTLSRSPIAPR